VTTERWTDDMLDRLVGAVSSLSGLSEQNTRDISVLGQSINRLASVAELNQQALDMQQQNFNAVITEIREIQSEVRGLQTENRHVLDQLINRNGENG
jgi:ABC-type transporter Mla subunit MlaD